MCTHTHTHIEKLDCVEKNNTISCFWHFYI